MNLHSFWCKSWRKIGVLGIVQKHDQQFLLKKKRELKSWPPIGRKSENCNSETVLQHSDSFLVLSCGGYCPVLPPPSPAWTRRLDLSHFSHMPRTRSDDSGGDGGGLQCSPRPRQFFRRDKKRARTPLCFNTKK